MYFEVVVICGGILVAGFVLGMLLSWVRPRDEEAAAAHRELARRASSWLPGRVRSHHDRAQPLAHSGVHR